MNPVPEATPQPASEADAQPPDPVVPDGSAEAVIPSELTRRGFLRGAAVAGGGIVAATLAACAPTATPVGWTFGPTIAPSGTGAPATSAPGSPAPATAAPTVAPSASPGNIPAGWTSHDISARNVVRRYVGNLAPALKDIYGEEAFAKLVTILGADEAYPELTQKPAFVQVPQLVINDLVDPLTPRVENGVKVFDMTVDEIEHKIDEMKAPVAAFGYNKQWPGPTIRVTEGDRIRVNFKNNLKETTVVHFHGQEFEDVFMDGVAFVNQPPIAPGETFAYEFTANRPGSLMYHSHHNATDQVGRGLLGAFVVDPKNPGPDDQYDREYVWISNDTLGGFTINAHGFPAVVPVLAAQGETVRVRFMNEGIMMHPWHSHGYKMRVVARDGYPLGSAAFECDTLGVNPGERFDVNIVADRLGIWAFHCHVLPHVEGLDGMFGMVTTLIVVPEKAHVDAILQALLA